MIRGCVVVFLSIHLFKQVQIVNAFTSPCNASLETIRNVTMCPSDNSSYLEAAKKKNCSSLAANAYACKSFQYHCVLSDDLKHAIEVCAPSIYIVGYSCAKFSTKHNSIMRTEGLPCNDSSTDCSFGYNSTEAFKYSLCYANVNIPLSTEIPQRTESSKSFPTWLIIVPSLFLFFGIGGLLVSFMCNRKRRTLRGGLLAYTPPPGAILEPLENRDNGNGETWSLLEDRDQLIEEDSSQRNERHVESHSQHLQDQLPVATNREQLTDNGSGSHQWLENIQDQLINEANSSTVATDGRASSDQSHTQSNERNLQTEEGSVSSISPDHQETSSNEGTWFKASMKTTISSSSEKDQSMLEGVVNLLLLNLENPDESWTKVKIISHVEKTIQLLKNSKTEQLFTSFITRLCNDEKIATTLLKCGVELFELISSIQERYSAGKIEFTDGCVCVTFCFADEDDLTNYLEKVLNKDEELITDLSRILLNKTLLSVFNIDPDLVSWTAYEVIVYKGSQPAEKVTFKESLTGSPKDYSEANRSTTYARETYGKKPFSKSSELSVDFEEKCDMFSSEEPSDYPGYMRYNTRVLSFDGARNWLEVKKNEFAKFGFLYKGIGLRTACFHCGCFKDDWTEEDNIFETHVFLRKSCAYVQYINTL